MSDLIRRQDAINLCEKWRNRTNEHHDKNGWYIADTLLKAIKELPSADRPQGEWIYCEDYVGHDGYKCSECGFFVPWCYDVYADSNFIRHYHTCPHCDSRMEGTDDAKIVVNGKCALCGKTLSDGRLFVCKECEDYIEEGAGNE